MEAAGSAVDAEALCTPVKRLLRPAGSTQQVASMLALLRTGCLEDALVGCKQLVDFACASKMQETACDGREVAGAAGALAAVVRAMHAHTQLQALGCLAVIHLCCGHARNRARAGACGAIDAVVTAIAFFGTNAHPDEATVPLSALRSLIEEHADNIAAAIAAGAIDRVVTSVCAYLASVPLQSTGWYCLRTLIEADAAAARIRAIDVGAIDAVLAMMEMHAGHCGLIADGCCALRGLYSELVVDSSHAFTLANAAVAAVLRALDAHRGDVHVQHQGCFALQAIWDSACTHQIAAVASSTAVHSVLAALRAHPGSACVQESGIAALVQVCSEPAGEAKAVAAAAGALELVLAAMGTYLAEEGVQRNGCFALASFLQKDATMAAATHARMAAAVVRAMRAHAGSAVLQHGGCGALGHIGLRSGASLAAAQAAGAVEAVVAAMRTLRGGGFATAPPPSMPEICLHVFVTLLRPPDVHDTAAAVAAHDAAVRAGALECIRDLGPTALDQSVFVGVEAMLAAAARYHDAAPCAHAAACQRCTAARACGKMCLLPSCGARRRTDAGDAKKKLLRCARCEKAMYCSKAHQIADWAPRHEAECRKPQAGGGRTDA
jgi:hypothetical protein